MAYAKNFKPGDIITCDGGEHLSYVYAMDKGRVGINACSRSWVKSGRRAYGQELYYLNEDDDEIYERVGHFGDGCREDGRAWYYANESVAV